MKIQGVLMLNLFEMNKLIVFFIKKKNARRSGV